MSWGVTAAAANRLFWSGLKRRSWFLMERRREWLLVLCSVRAVSTSLVERSNAANARVSRSGGGRDGVLPEPRSAARTSLRRRSHAAPLGRFFVGELRHFNRFVRVLNNDVGAREGAWWVPSAQRRLLLVHGARREGRRRSASAVVVRLSGVARRMTATGRSGGCQTCFGVRTSVELRPRFVARKFGGSRCGGGASSAVLLEGAVRRGMLLRARHHHLTTVPRHHLDRR